VAKVSDFKPLVDEDATPEERALLGAARAYEPAKELRQRLLKRLGVSGVALSFALLLSKFGLRGLVTSTFKFWSLTVLSVGVVSAVSYRAYQVSELKERMAETTTIPETGHAGPLPAPSRLAEPPASETIATAAPSTEPPILQTVSPSVKPAKSAPVGAETTSTSGQIATARADTLQDESAYIGEARELLNQGKAGKSKEMLLRFREHFPSARLDAEATVLLIEAQAKSGERNAARRTGTTFLQRSPNHILAAKVHSILRSLEDDGGVH
jgi:hypothetical protein